MAAASHALGAVEFTGPLFIHFDGSVRYGESDGDRSAAIGYTLSSSADVLAESSARLAYWRSNTHVEYDALIAALTHALSHGYGHRHINVYGDSKSVIHVVHPARDSSPNDRVTANYAKRVRTLLEEFPSYNLQYTKRSKNSRADALAAAGHTETALLSL